MDLEAKRYLPGPLHQSERIVVKTPVRTTIGAGPGKGSTWNPQTYHLANKPTVVPRETTHYVSGEKATLTIAPSGSASLRVSMKTPEGGLLSFGVAVDPYDPKGLAKAMDELATEIQAVRSR